jgi:hypothetical protein
MGGYMTKARLPMTIAILIAVFSITPALGQEQEECTVLEVLPGEHIVLEATPNQPDNYNYDWTGWTFRENGEDVPRDDGGLINTPTLTFDAPTAPDDYTVSLFVGSKSAGSCNDRDCYIIRVVDTGCPEFGTYCITSTPPTWAWTGIRHTSYNYAWTVNTIPVGTNAYQYTPTAWETSPLTFIMPTDPAPIQKSTVALTITQMPLGHTLPITLKTCPGINAVTLVFKPDAAITSNVANA